MTNYTSPELALALDTSLAAIRDRWMAIGLSTDPADRPRAEAAVRLAYRRAGLSDSIRMIWTGSPMGGAVMADSLTWRASRARHVADVMNPAIGPMTRRALESIGTDVAQRIASDVASPLAAHVARQVWEPINHKVARHIKRPIALPGYAQHDAPRLAFYDALRETGVDVSELDALMEIAQSCGWWWPYNDVCVLSERPSVLARDAGGRLRSSNGPAVVYPDGWSVDTSPGARA